MGRFVLASGLQLRPPVLGQADGELDLDARVLLLEGGPARAAHDLLPRPAVAGDGDGAPGLRPGLPARDTDGGDRARGQRGPEKASAVEPHALLETRLVDHSRRAPIRENP